MLVRRVYKPDTDRQLEALLQLLRSVPDSQLDSEANVSLNTTAAANGLTIPHPGGDHEGGGRTPPSRTEEERR